MAKDEPIQEDANEDTGSTSAATTGYPPGDWVIVHAVGPDNSRGLYILGGDGDVCDLYTERKDEHGISRELVPFPNSQQKARLIAAAPDLLAACNDAISKIDDCVDGKINFRSDFADRLRAAVAKAVGG